MGEADSVGFRDLQDQEGCPNTTEETPGQNLGDLWSGYVVIRYVGSAVWLAVPKWQIPVNIRGIDALGFRCFLVRER